MMHVNLFENFLIDSDSKKRIIDLIDSIKSNPDVNDNPSIRPLYGSMGIYPLLRKSTNVTSYSDNTNPQIRQIKQDWEVVAKNKKLYRWSGWVGYMEKLYDKSNGETYNYYISIDCSSLENIENYIHNLYKLHNSLKQLSSKLKKTILWKTHDTFSKFVKDNDSFKVYWYDNSREIDIKSKILEVIKKWLSDNNIKILNRKHNTGIDLKWVSSTGDDKSFSFGQILAHLLYYKLYHFTIRNKSNSSYAIYNAFEKELNKNDGLIDKIKKQRKSGFITNDKIRRYIEECPNSLMDANYFK